VSQRNLSSAPGGLWVVGCGLWFSWGIPWAFCREQPSWTASLYIFRFATHIHTHPFIPSSLLVSPTLPHSFRFFLSRSYSFFFLFSSFFLLFFPRLLLRLFIIIRLVQDLIYHPIYPPISCIYYHNDHNEQKTSHHIIVSSSSHHLIVENVSSSSSHRHLIISSSSKTSYHHIVVENVENVDIPLMDQPNDPIELGISSNME
jgi:hypothetical protein